MASTSETGHVKNNAKFKALIAVAEMMGTPYAPVKSSIQIALMNEQHEAAVTNFTELNIAKAGFNNFTNQRAEAFDMLSPFLPRMLSNIRLADASERTLEDASGYISKMRGGRRNKIKDADTTGNLTITEGETTGEPKESISVSQRSFDNVIDHFEKLVMLVSGLSGYATNDAELSMNGLESRLASLKEVNKQVVTAGRQVAERMILRDKQLYADKTGILSTAEDVKDYLRTLSGGTRNEHYKAAVKIQFKRPANLA